MTRSIRNRWTIVATGAAAALCAGPTAFGESETTYRLAGTMAIDADRTVALIESSTGAQDLCRVGEVLDDWEVSVIDADAVTLVKGGQ